MPFKECHTDWSTNECLMESGYTTPPVTRAKNRAIPMEIDNNVFDSTASEDEMEEEEHDEEEDFDEEDEEEEENDEDEEYDIEEEDEDEEEYEYSEEDEDNEKEDDKNDEKNLDGYEENNSDNSQNSRVLESDDEGPPYHSVYFPYGEDFVHDDDRDDNISQENDTMEEEKDDKSLKEKNVG